MRLRSKDSLLAAAAALVPQVHLNADGSGGLAIEAEAGPDSDSRKETRCVAPASPFRPRRSVLRVSENVLLTAVGLLNAVAILAPPLDVSQDEPPTLDFHHTVNTSACEQFWRMLNKHKHTFRSSRPETLPAGNCNVFFKAAYVSHDTSEARRLPIPAEVRLRIERHACGRVGFSVAFFDLGPEIF